MASINYTSIVGGVGAAVTQTETELESLVTSDNAAPTTADLVLMQQKVSQWSLLVNMNSTITKEFSDALKGIVQKIS